MALKNANNAKEQEQQEETRKISLGAMSVEDMEDDEDIKPTSTSPNPPKKKRKVTPNGNNARFRAFANAQKKLNENNKENDQALLNATNNTINGRTMKKMENMASTPHHPQKKDANTMPT